MLWSKNGFYVVSILTKLIEMEHGIERSIEIKETIKNLSLNLFVSYRNGYISYNELASKSEFIKQTLSRIIDYFEMPFAFDLAELKNDIDKTKTEIVSLLKTHLTKKLVASFQELIDNFDDEKLLNSIFNDESKTELRKSLLPPLRALWEIYFSNGHSKTKTK